MPDLVRLPESESAPEYVELLLPVALTLRLLPLDKAILPAPVSPPRL